MNSPELTGPLCLTPFERYMMMDERSGYPMTFPLVWRVSGGIDRAEFEAAFQEALSWHPLLRGCVGDEGWILDRPAETHVSFVASDQRFDCESSVDCHVGPMVRCRVVGNGLEQEVQFVFHHMATDGVCGAEFCGDVFCLYAKKKGGLVRPLHRPVPEGLPDRAMLDRAVSKPVSRWTAAKFVTKETLRFLSRRSESVRPENGFVRNDAAWQMADCLIDREQTQRVIEAADGLNATLNDWAMVALMRSVGRWNDQQNGSRSNGWIVANMPVHMRPRGARRRSACNAIGYSFLARRRRAVDDWLPAVKNLAKETKAIQEWKMAGMFVDAVALTLRCPGAMRLATSRLLRPASFVMSCIGDPSRRFRTRLPADGNGNPVAGNLTILGMLGAAPCRPGTELTASVVTLGGKLSLSVRLTPRLFSIEACQQMVEIWKDEILREI